MFFFVSSVGNLLLLGLAVCGILYMISKKKKLPPGPVGLPIVGYIPFLGAEPHKTFENLCKKYGPVFSLYLGRSCVVVLCDYESVKEVFNKISACDRPQNFFHFLPDGTGLAELSGVEWMVQRKYTLKAMKTIGMGKSEWEKLVEDEVEHFVKVLRKSKGLPMSFYKQLETSISSNVLSLLFGYRLKAGDPRRGVVDKGINSFAHVHLQSGLSTFFPSFIELLQKLGFNIMGSDLQNMKAFNHYVRNEVELRRQLETDNEVAFIDGYLKEMKNNSEQQIKSSYNERNLIGNCQAMVIAGSETTRISIAWLFLIMAAFPEIQDKVQSEIDLVVGRDGKLEWGERARLPFICATIMEGQRWRTTVPLNLLHRANEDIKIGQYVIPKNASIMGLIWTLHKDPKYWKDPEEFIPERFLKEDGTLEMRPDSYTPFSMGKRICPGETVALTEIFLYFTNVMQKFRISPADGSAVKLEGILGLNLNPMFQDLRFVPRNQIHT